MVAGVEQDAEQDLAAGDPAPDREEVVALLELGQRRRMVARDEGDVADRRPQRVALGRRAQRRRALGDRAEALGVVLVEHEVVRAGLARRVDPARPGLGDERDPAAGRHVHDVQGAAGLLREQQGAADRLDLGDRRPRAQVVADAAPALAARAGGERARDRLALGVDGDRQPERRRRAPCPRRG